MLLQFFTIARNTFVESVRQPVLFLLVLLSGVLQVFSTWNTGFSMSQEESSQVSGDNKLMLDYGLGTIFVLGTLLAGFIATAVVSREIENKTVLTVVSKPVSRALLVLGKYAGVAGAISCAVFVMLLFLLMALRHGVLSTASDELDAPVLVFTFLGVGLSLAVAAWCNYFYGWSFPQTSILLLMPVMLVAYGLVLMFGKGWKVQPLYTDVKDQVLVASACLGMAVLVLTAVATAASTRLGQVMTIVVCLGVFLAALLSNHFLGRHVFKNTPIGMIQAASPDDPEKASFSNPGDAYTIQLDRPANEPPPPKSPFYYSPSPNGFPMMSRKPYSPFQGDLGRTEDTIGPTAAPALVVTEATRQVLRVRNLGARAVPVMRPPEAGDYVFTSPTSMNTAALAVWAVVPNLQYFWLLDAVSQNRPVPGPYLVLVAGYSLSQIGVFLSLAVILFQKRDVG